MAIKYIVPLFIAFCLGGCAHTAPAAVRAETAALSQSQAASREQLLLEAGKRPAGEAREKDDFIEVDDKKGFRKTWPMLLFIGLIAVAAGSL
jgi:hypothetical protein